MGVFSNLLGTVLSTFKVGRATLAATGLTAERTFALPDQGGPVALDLWATAGGTADALTATYSPAVTLRDGLRLRLRAAAANATTTPTLAVNGSSAYTIKKKGGAALAVGDIAGADHELELAVHDAFALFWYELLNPATDATGGAGSADAVKKSYTQTAHGLVIGTPVCWNGTLWVAADADSDTTMIEGFVSAVTDANTIVVTFSGLVTATAAEWLARNADGTNLVAGELYWTSTTAGKITATQPTTGFAQCIGKAESTTVLRVAIGPVIALTTTGAAAATPVYLDSYGTKPQCVLSLRKQVSTATRAVRARRSSDNTELDIGFLASGALDSATLLAFAAGGSAYVTTFYDQTLNGEDAVQATTTKQPRIVNAGVYDAALVFDGTDDFLKITSLTLGTPTLGVFVKANQLYTATRSIFEMGVAYNTVRGFGWRANSGNLKSFCYEANTGTGTDYRSMASTAVWPGARVISSLNDRSITGTTEMALFQGGRTLSNDSPDGSVEQTGNFTSQDAYIGASTAGTANFNNFSLETIVIYNADAAPLRPVIEGAIA